jgi:hypothetical protein
MPIAAIWIIPLLLTWRTRQQLWIVITVVGVFGGARLAGIFRDDVPTSQALQWLCFVVILAGAPLLFRIFRPFEAAAADAFTDYIRCPRRT